MIDPLSNTLLFASQNENKVNEIRSLLQGSYTLKSLNDVGFNDALDEPYDTFNENAKTKAKQGYNIFGYPCFSEDAGLVVNALDGKPGVKSARYAGEHKSAIENLNKVLNEMRGIYDRNAYFIAVIAFYDGTDFEIFEGRVYGTITTVAQGTHGFGYDPIFIPLGYNKTFGQLDDTIKNLISHRNKAINQFISWLHISENKYCTF